MMYQADVVVIGAGPAGCSYALNLAPFARVLLLERYEVPPYRAGESLPPAANALLRDMGLWDDFIQQGHLPHYGNQSRWGSDELQETDFLRDPNGHGWHLHRQQFEQWMRAKATERGAVIWTGVKPEQFLQQENGQWLITVSHNGEKRGISASLLVDAGGRQSSVATRTGAVRVQTDALICTWLIGQDDPDNPQGMSYIQSDKEGWWYTAPLTNGRRIIAWHTDAQAGKSQQLRSVKEWWNVVQQQRLLTEFIAVKNFADDPSTLQHGTTAARSTHLTPCAGKGWVAVGDAALGFDPLSSQGIFNALYTGLAAAENSYQLLAGNTEGFDSYIHRIAQVQKAYQQHLQKWYGEERRWASHEFWRKRHELLT